MLLSILIPAYNENPAQLVQELAAAARNWGGEWELIVGDDGSDEAVNVECSTLNEDSDSELSNPLNTKRSTINENISIWRTERNLGRAGIRNRLADMARGEWLWFIDSDARVPAGFSINQYVDAMEGADAVCGGVASPEANPNPKATLRWLWERSVYGRRTAAVRQLHPCREIGTFNLMVRREAFMQIRFDEECREYGYEDTLFGAEMERRGMTVRHIDNPLLHMGLEDNDVFLSKTETSLRTLYGIRHKMPAHSRLLQTAERLERWHVAGLFRQAYRMARPLLRRNLLGRKPSLKVFSMYKLGYFLDL